MARKTVSTVRVSRPWAWRTMFLAMAGMSLAACAGGPRPSTSTGVASSRTPLHGTEKPYQVNGVWYYPKSQPNYDEIGMASWYGQRGHNPYTADGEVFDDRLPSGAHKTLPLPSLVEVTNLANGRTLVVRLNDRGPFVSGRVIDLSREAAAELDFLTAGVTRVRVRYIGQADGSSPKRRFEASSSPPVQPRPTALPDVDSLLADTGTPQDGRGGR